MSMSVSQSRPGIRFTLKKRCVAKKTEDVSLSSYNSDFLSGLFADVAKISELSDSETLPKRDRDYISESHVVDESPSKKLCTSLSRSNFSTRNLADLATLESVGFEKDRIHAKSYDPVSPRSIASDVLNSRTKDSGIAPIDLLACSQHDSLAFQLGCVAGETDSSNGTAAMLAFPNLPATVSDSSCSVGLTRASRIRQASSLEKNSKESFGWFVALDDDDHQIRNSNSDCYSTSYDDLAFKAPTAPHGSKNDAEVQWAKAADTVDDVLGDFF